MDARPRRPARAASTLVLTLLAIELLDELVFGARDAAWPLIRQDLGLDYGMIGLLLGVPNIVANVVEPALGILGDVRDRRPLIVGGGIAFGAALGLAALATSAWTLMLALLVLYPASGAFVSLSQATLMDAEPRRHRENMVRWTLAGSVGVVAGPLLLRGASAVGNVFGLVAGLLPMALGALAGRFGPGAALWLLVVGPLALLVGVPREDGSAAMGGA